MRSLKARSILIATFALAVGLTGCTSSSGGGTAQRAGESALAALRPTGAQAVSVQRLAPMGPVSIELTGSVDMTSDGAVDAIRDGAESLWQDLIEQTYADDEEIAA